MLLNWGNRLFLSGRPLYNMEKQINKYNEFLHKVVKHLIKETDADYCDRNIVDIGGDIRYVKYVFYFPWTKKRLPTGYHYGWISNSINDNIREEFEKYRELFPDPTFLESIIYPENFTNKWGPFINYLNDIYGMSFEECFRVWELFSKSVKKKYDLN